MDSRDDLMEEILEKVDEASPLPVDREHFRYGIELRFQRIRDQALEEAAKVAEATGEHDNVQCGCAMAIRALKDVK